ERAGRGLAEERPHRELGPRAQVRALRVLARAVGQREGDGGAFARAQRFAPAGGGVERVAHREQAGDGQVAGVGRRAGHAGRALGRGAEGERGEGRGDGVFEHALLALDNGGEVGGERPEGARGAGAVGGVDGGRGGVA